MSRIFSTILIGLMFAAHVCAHTSPDTYELKVAGTTLRIDGKGNLRIWQDKGQFPEVHASVYKLWKFVLRTSNRSELVCVPDKNLKIKKGHNAILLTVNSVRSEDNTIPVQAVFSISVKDSAFCFSGSLHCESKDWTVKELNFPAELNITVNNDDTKVYWPDRLGTRFDSPKTFGSREFNYPDSHGSMAWYSVNDKEGGIYLGGHDPLRGSKKFYLHFDPSEKVFRTGVGFPVYGRDFTVPDIILSLYQGSWHYASKYYRAWHDRNFKLPEISQWTKENAGLMLTILKQQNGSVNWNYKDMDHLCDIAEKLNIKLIGLWGRGVGGHDRLYPNYTPDNLLGGREELKKAIDRAHQRGFKVVVYSNGTIMDASTDFYTYNGIQTLLLNERKQPNIEYYLKHRNTTPVIQAMACPGSSLWRKTITDLALDAKSLGVDAFYIDQVGVRGPLMCYSERHDHATPQEAYTKYRVQMMREVRNKMKAIDPEFSIITEGSIDELLTDIDVFHALGPTNFPEMFRYTFPESIVIMLNASPATSRFDANYAALYGLRHEIMSRYEADADYLKYGKIPTAQSYADCFVNNPPPLHTMNQATPQEVTQYTHDLIGFENENNRFFRTGKFIDQDGIEFRGNDVAVKGFVNGTEIGVVAWNKHLSEKRDFSVSVPGYKLIKASEPGKPDAEASSPLDPNSIRLLVFERE